MDIALLFGGVVVSLIVQAIKKYAGTDTPGTLISVVVLSILGGVGFWYLQHANLWNAFLEIIISCGAVYAFIIKNVED